MTIATVLTSIDGGSGSESALRAALAVGRAFEAHVELLHVRMSPEATVPIIGDGMTGAAIEQIIESAEEAAGERAKAAHELFERLCLYAQPGEEGGPAVVDAEERPPVGRFTVSWCAGRGTRRGSRCRTYPSQARTLSNSKPTNG